MLSLAALAFKNPELRFWQLIRWELKCDKVLVDYGRHDVAPIDTFYFEGLDR